METSIAAHCRNALYPLFHCFQRFFVCIQRTAIAFPVSIDLIKCRVCTLTSVIYESRNNRKKIDFLIELVKNKDSTLGFAPSLEYLANSDLLHNPPSAWLYMTKTMG